MNSTPQASQVRSRHWRFKPLRHENCGWGQVPRPSVEVQRLLVVTRAALESAPMPDPHTQLTAQATVNISSGSEAAI